MNETEMRTLIRVKRDTWRNMRDNLMKRELPWVVELSSRYESYDLVASVLNELLELIEDQPS